MPNVKWKTENGKCGPGRMLTCGDAATPAGRARSPNAPQCRPLGCSFTIHCGAAGVRALPSPVSSEGQSPCDEVPHNRRLRCGTIPSRNLRVPNFVNFQTKAVQVMAFYATIRASFGRVPSVGITTAAATLLRSRDSKPMRRVGSSCRVCMWWGDDLQLLLLCGE